MPATHAANVKAIVLTRVVGTPRISAASSSSRIATTDLPNAQRHGYCPAQEDVEEKLVTGLRAERGRLQVQAEGAVGDPEDRDELFECEGQDEGHDREVGAAQAQAGDADGHA